MIRVLIVDDIEGWRKFNSDAVNNILGKTNVKIDTAECASTAYNLVLENNNKPYDIIITDMQMEDDYTPKHAGEWFVEQVKMLSAYYKTKIIMISASSYAKIVAENNQIDYIPKSYQLNSIALLEEKIKY